MLRIEDYIRDFTNPELQTVIPFQNPAFDPFAIDECPMLAALVNNTERAILRNDQGVVPGDRGSAITRSLSTFRPTAKGLWSRLITRCSLPWTNTRVGNTPEPVPEDGPIIVWKAMQCLQSSLMS